MDIKPLRRWESCRLEDRKTELPKTSGLYAVLNGNKIMYIGRSTNLNKRWSSGHHRYPQAAQLRNPRIAWVCLSEWKINKAEGYLINQYQPAWNWTKVSKIPAWLAVWKPRLIALGLAAIAGIVVGLLTLPEAPPEPRPTETLQLNK